MAPPDLQSAFESPVARPAGLFYTACCPRNVKGLDVKTGLMLDLLQNSMQIFEDEEMT